MEKLKVFEMFAGYGGASFGLKMAGIDHEVVGFSEIDKFATQCWHQNHGEEVKNWGDCTKINPHDLPDFDLLTGGFPCQAFSVTGRGQGVDDEKGRGLLFNDIIRIAEVKKPRYMLLENVKGLLSKKHKDFFEFTKSELKRLGYEIDVRVYKSSDYGTPQLRERIYYACQLKKLNYIPPIKKEPMFFTSVLEHHVNSSYQLSERAKEGKTKSNYRDRKPFDYTKFCPTLKVGGDVKNIKFSWDDWRIITEKEAFRCQGFFNDEINLDGLSRTQCYKLAGNGWDVNLVKQIFETWFKK
jgi:DNA (cytosine-5)-methyltransferase 1